MVADELPPLPPEGWHPDPGGRWLWRWWDGSDWTTWVSNGRWTTNEPLRRVEPDGRALLPVRAIWWGIGGVVVGELFGLGLFLLADWVSNDRRVVELVLSQLGLWAGFTGALVIASRRYGTGHLFQDFGVRMKRNDVWLGLGLSLLGRVLGIVALIPIVTIFRHYFQDLPTDNSILGVDKEDRGALITVAVIATIGAPFIEEMLFRGLIMGSLRRLGAVWALILQAVLFGSVHMEVDAGRRNILTFVAIACAGLVLGWCAQHYKRLGVGMWTHFFFNLLAVGILLATSF